MAAVPGCGFAAPRAMLALLAEANKNPSRKPPIAARIFAAYNFSAIYSRAPG